MLIPALNKRTEIISKMQKMRYTTEIYYYNGCLEQGEVCISDEPTTGRFQYAICDDKENVVGYLGYWIDFYSSCAWSFGLISFEKKPNRFIGYAIFETINKLKKMNIKRVEFCAVSGNPAVKFYDSITMKYFSTGLYSLRRITKLRTTRDEYGNYHDSINYEIIHWDSLKEKIAELEKHHIRKTTAYIVGYENGHEDGLTEGYQKGFESGKEKILREISDGE